MLHFGFNGQWHSQVPLFRSREGMTCNKLHLEKMHLATWKRSRCVRSHIYTLLKDEWAHVLWAEMLLTQTGQQRK